MAEVASRCEFLSNGSEYISEARSSPTTVPQSPIPDIFPSQDGSASDFKYCPLYPPASPMIVTDIAFAVLFKPTRPFLPQTLS